MTYPTSSSASDVWSLRDVYKAVAGEEWPALGPSALTYTSYVAEGDDATVTTHSINTLPSDIAAGDLVLYVLVLDGDQTLADGDQPTGFTFLNAGVTTGSLSEYPDAMVAYRIWDGTETTPITSNESFGEPYSAALIVFRPTGPINTVTSPDYDAVNGASAENLTVCEGGTVVPSLNFVFSCGRPTTQAPTLTYADADQIIETTGTGLTNGNLSFGYQIFGLADTPASASVSTNDTGRQILAGLNIEVA